jgi:hypothetical protein
MKKGLIIGSAAVILAVAALYFFVFRTDLSGRIAIPYISHQKPKIDPHIPSAVPISDKLDEALFDGLFNVSANPSGIVYEDGLGEYMGIHNNVVSIRLKPKRKWQRSFTVTANDDEYSISENEAVLFTAKDIAFTLRRIQRLGSLSPDYILISQAVENMSFSGPDENNEIHFPFRSDREWPEADIKEILSFKILPHDSDMNAPNYTNGSGPYLYAGIFEDKFTFLQNPASKAKIGVFTLQPYIDNSALTTELKNGNINALLSAPYGSESPLLADKEDFFPKSNISTVFFAIFYNFERLSKAQRIELRKLIDHQKILDRFFKVGTQQQRHISDYKGNKDNYNDYLNYSIFPSSSYYVDEKVVLPLIDKGAPNLSVLPDTIRIKTCLNYGFREELIELVNTLNDPALFKGKIKASAVSNEELAKGNYDAVLLPVSGYRSNFLFDLYDIFLREPNLAVKKINLITDSDVAGTRRINKSSLSAHKNFFRIGLEKNSEEHSDYLKLLDYIYGFMSTREVGDKQAYAQFLDELDQEIALGSWLFSLPSLAYFSSQLNEQTIHLYGTASQLSTIENWEEKEE